MPHYKGKYYPNTPEGKLELASDKDADKKYKAFKKPELEALEEIGKGFIHNLTQSGVLTKESLYAKTIQFKLYAEQQFGIVDSYKRKREAAQQLGYVSFEKMRAGYEKSKDPNKNALLATVVTTFRRILNKEGMPKSKSAYDMLVVALGTAGINPHVLMPPFNKPAPDAGKIKFVASGHPFPSFGKAVGKKKVVATLDKLFYDEKLYNQLKKTHAANKQKKGVQHILNNNGMDIKELLDYTVVDDANAPIKVGKPKASAAPGRRLWVAKFMNGPAKGTERKGHGEPPGMIEWFDDEAAKDSTEPSISFKENKFGTLEPIHAGTGKKIYQYVMTDYFVQGRKKVTGGEGGDVIGDYVKTGRYFCSTKGDA